MSGTVILLRGVPGSGKSSLARLLVRGSMSNIVSADHYMVDENGNYKFDRSKLAYAHLSCQDCYLSRLQGNRSLVVLDNTNIKRKDFKFYKDLAREYGYIFIEVTVGDFNVKECAQRNLHGVPIETIQRMKDDFQLMAPDEKLSDPS